MSVEQIRKVIGSLSKLIDDGEKIAVAVFSMKLAKASEHYPEDQTIGIMANVTERMVGSNKLFITRAEIKDLYNKLYTRNTKFAELFKDELGEVEKISEPTIYTRDANEDHSSITESYNQSVDPVLANALAAAMGEKVKTYTDSSANSAKIMCARELNGFGLEYSDISIKNGQENFILCSASFTTPKGTTTVFVPVELVNQKALIPSVFIGNAGPEDFTKAGLIEYVVKNAGAKLTVQDTDILKAINTIKNSNEISNVDMALTKLNASKEKQGDFYTSSGSSILFQKVAEVQENLVVNMPKYNDPEMETFAHKFASAIGEAAFKFGDDKVNTARNTIARCLSGFGVTNSQVSVIDSDNSTITYAVSVNSGKTAFRVPIKVDSNKTLFPNIFIANGTVNTFSKTNILDLISSGVTDSRAGAVASPLYDLKPSDLINTVRDAVEEKNYSKAEDALNVLAESNDPKAYQTAFAVYVNGLNPTKEAEVKTNCSMIVRTSSSNQPTCGHTGLPLNKVYQDKNGDCHPAYRKGMDESYEGACLTNHKIFL